MRELAIATGNNRQQKVWSNRTISFESLRERLRTPLRTSETALEYAKMKKADRDSAKDHGGFVAGTLIDGCRKLGHVKSRSMLSFDGDRITTDFLNSFVALCPYASVLYSTHSSTSENPRVRILMPLSRDVTAEEFVALSRYTAQDLGIDYFDECSYLPNQLMYWPSMPSDAPFIYKETTGPWMDPDVVLKAHPSWQDPTSLPISSRETKANSASQKKVQDPLSKEGTVGLFNRAYYPITLALETFLSDVYEPTEVENRWHYIPSSSMAGVEIIEDKFVYSHHARDVAYCKLSNAFDIVRIHKFGDLEDKASYNAMCEFAMKQEEVRVLATNERLKEAQADFAPSEDDSWKKALTYSSKGVLENTSENLTLILLNDSDCKNFAFNELAGRVQVTGPLAWSRPVGNVFWRDADTAQLQALLDKRYLAFSTRNFDIAFTKVADLRRFHPIRDYLDSLPPWDGVKRVEDLFIKYLEADDSDYVRSVTRKTFAAAISRIYKPGTKFDCVPVLDGAQGIGKSTIVKDLVGSAYYSETLSLTDMNDKSGAEKLQGFWAVEIGELAGMKKADIEKVKAFLSTCDDKYRPSYGRVVESHPRQCIILATVNGERGYLRDITGNRRFWIIKLHQKNLRKDWNFDEDFRLQFWAEAKAIWQSGEKLYLEGEVLEASEKAQMEAMETDDRIGMVEAYLDTMLPEDWSEMNLYQRRTYLQGNEFGQSEHKGTVRRMEVSNAEIWQECFCKNVQELKSTDSYAIAAIMKQIPTWHKSETIRSLKYYGRQRVYRRDE